LISPNSIADSHLARLARSETQGQEPVRDCLISIANFTVEDSHLLFTKRTSYGFIGAGLGAGLLVLFSAGLFFWRGQSVRAASGTASQTPSANRQNDMKQAYGRLPMSF
jgi:hypothetical protein